MCAVLAASSVWILLSMMGEGRGMSGAVQGFGLGTGGFVVGENRAGRDGRLGEAETLT